MKYKTILRYNRKTLKIFLKAILGEGKGKWEIAFIADGRVNWCNLSEGQFGNIYQELNTCSNLLIC